MYIWNANIFNKFINQLHFNDDFSVCNIIVFVLFRHSLYVHSASEIKALCTAAILFFYNTIKVFNHYERCFVTFEHFVCWKFILTHCISELLKFYLISSLFLVVVKQSLGPTDNLSLIEFAKLQKLSLVICHPH